MASERQCCYKQTVAPAGLPGPYSQPEQPMCSSSSQQGCWGSDHTCGNSHACDVVRPLVTKWRSRKHAVKPQNIAEHTVNSVALCHADQLASSQVWMHAAITTTVVTSSWHEHCANMLLFTAATGPAAIQAVAPRGAPAMQHTCLLQESSAGAASRGPWVIVWV